MSRICGIDLETTGLDIEKDRILKFGWVIKDHDSPVTLCEREYTVWAPNYPKSSEEAFRTHQIREKDVEEFGITPPTALWHFFNDLYLSKVEYVVAHNGIKFDFKMLKNHVKLFGSEVNLDDWGKMKLIDTCVDIKYPSHIKTRKLDHLAAEHGFLNPFPHSTLSDIKTMLKILSMYPFESVVEEAQAEKITIQALVSYDNREHAKARYFHWSPSESKWLKTIKASDIEKERNELFQIAICNNQGGLKNAI